MNFINETYFKICLFKNRKSLFSFIISIFKILLPAYRFNLGLQSTGSSIADVLPGIMFLKNRWEKANVDPEARELCYFLVHFLQIKYRFELESPIYKVNKNH
jgi:hypothetical protein